MKKILITAIGGDIGYGVIKALKAGGQDLHIIGCDIKQYNCSLDLVDEFETCPPYTDDGQWTDYMKHMIAEKQVDYFWPVTEPEIRIVNRDPKAFANTVVIMNRPNVLAVAMDKGETARFLMENGVNTPKTWSRIPTEEQDYPLIIKEKFGCGSHSVALIHNREELVQAFEEMESPIIQECIGNKSEEYTLTVFSDGNVINSIAFRRELGFGGMSRYVELSHDQKLYETGERIARMFDLRGSVNVQLRKQDGEYYVFEINPRISSTVGFRSLLGFYDVAWWMDMVEGKKVEKYTIPEGEVHGVKTVEEKIFREQGRNLS